MTQAQVKEQLNALIDLLPTEQAELVLDFAVLLRQRQVQTKPTEQVVAVPDLPEWETDLAAAEEYWFQLSDSVRAQYQNKTVALLRDKIIDADIQLQALRKRVTSNYPDQPVLYLDAGTEKLLPLYIRSPRLR
jgi:hypothetical protein